MKKKETKKELTDFAEQALTAEESQTIQGGGVASIIIEDAEGI
ncbi:MAG: hypothetical protein AB8B56_18265 [Crocinitomicaceae bacterium]